MIGNNRRVLIDWDDDGYFNRAVAETPLNLTPSPLSMGLSGLRGEQHTTGDDYSVDIEDIDDLGYFKRTVKFGWTASENYAEKLVGAVTYKTGQKRYSDLPNLVSDSSNLAASFSSWPDFATTVDGGFSRRVFANTPYGGYYETVNVDGLTQAGYFTPNYIILGGGSAWTNTNLISTVATLEYSVVAGQSYTVALWAKLDWHSGKWDFALRPFYKSGFTQTFIGASALTHPITALNPGEWHQMLFQVYVPVGVTELGFGMYNNTFGLEAAAGQSLKVAGFSMFDGVLPDLPNRFWDQQSDFEDNQFPVIVPGSTDARYAVYVKSPDGIDNLTVNAWDVQLGTQTFTQFITNASVTVTSAWTRYEFALPNRAYEYGLYIEATAEVGGVAAGLDVVGNLDLKAAMQWEGTEVDVPFNTGTVLGYDDVTGWVTSVNWKSGKNTFGEALPYEGTADIEINNTSKIFSPNNVLSPLYGYMRQNIKVAVQLKDPSTLDWTTMWTGWIENFAVDPGTTSNRRTHVNCNQGMFRLREGEFKSRIVGNTRMDAVVQQLVENSGWRMPNSPLQTIIGFGNQLGVDTYCVDTDEIFARKDQGVNQLTLVGQDWGRKTKLERALDDVIKSENGQLWIARNGQLVLVNRNYWINARENITATLNLDTQVQESEYVYGEDIVNSAEVTLQEKTERTNEPIWETRSPMYVGRSQKRDVKINFQFESGRQKTITEISNDITSTVYKTNPNALTGTPEQVSGGELDMVILRILQDGSGAYTFRVENRNGFPVWVDASLTGSFVDVGNEEAVIEDNEEGIAAAGAIYKLRVSTPILDTEVEARALANTEISRNSSPDGEFKSITIRQEDDADTTLILSLTIGSFVEIRETQTGETGRYHVVIAESGNIDDAGSYDMEYTLARVDEETYAVSDSSLAGSSRLNLIEDMTITAVSSGFIDKLKDADNTEFWRLGGDTGSSPAAAIVGLDKRAILDMVDTDLRQLSAPYLTSVGVPRTSYAKTLLTSGARYSAPYSVIVSSTGYDYWNWIVPSAYENAALVKEGGSAFWPVQPDTKYRIYWFVDGAFGTIRLNLMSLASGYAGHLAVAGFTNAGTSSGIPSYDFETTDTLGRKCYGAGLQATNALHLTLVRVDGRYMTPIVAGVDHYFSVWAKLADGTINSGDFGVTLWGADGTYLGGTDFVATDTLQKFEMLIPDTESKVFAEIVNRDAYAPKLDIYYWAITEGVAPDSYETLEDASPDVALAYV